MNTAVLALQPVALEAEQPPHTSGAVRAEAQPLCWRSEAFPEDLADLVLPTAQGSRAQPARPLLRRVMGVVLRR